MDFIKTFQSDQGIWERALAFSPQLPRPIKRGRPADKVPSFPPAVEILDNGDLMLRYAGPGATDVKVRIKEREVILEQKEGGYFEACLPYDPTFPGPHAVHWVVNGADVLHPYCPIWFGQDKPVNYVEFPDEEIADLISIHDVPRGSVTMEIFYSEAAGRHARCFVYTPPGYEKGDQEYPVLYLQHGATENETTWVFNGKLTYILDNLNAQGKITPFIVVMNDGMIMAADEESSDSFTAFEAILTKESRELVEAKYRVKTDKWNRALAGLSRGSTQASSIGLSHPELYGYIGLFSGFMRKFNMPVHAENPHLKVFDDTEQFAKDYRIFFRSIGEEESESQVGRFLEDDEFLKERGFFDHPQHIRKMYPYMSHEWGCWRRALRDFSQVIFKD